MLDLDKPLRRSNRNVVVAGVCGGLAEWLGWDPTVVRVLWIGVSFMSAGFPGLLLYVALAFIIPKELDY